MMIAPACGCLSYATVTTVRPIRNDRVIMTRCAGFTFPS